MSLVNDPPIFGTSIYKYDFIWLLFLFFFCHNLFFVIFISILTVYFQLVRVLYGRVVCLGMQSNANDRRQLLANWSQLLAFLVE